MALLNGNGEKDEMAGSWEEERGALRVTLQQMERALAEGRTRDEKMLSRLSVLEQRQRDIWRVGAWIGGGLSVAMLVVITWGTNRVLRQVEAMGAAPAPIAEYSLEGEIQRMRLAVRSFVVDHPDRTDRAYWTDAGAPRLAALEPYARRAGLLRVERAIADVALLAEDGR